MRSKNPLLTLAVLVAALVAISCGTAQSTAVESSPPASSAPEASQEGLAKAVFAGGCFWCMEPPFDKTEGVVATISGYTAGERPNPTYKQVSAGLTRHTEAVEILYDPSKVSYEELLAVYWRNVDPLTADRQFCDRGSQYRPGIYYGNDEEQRLAEASKKHWEDSGRFDQPIVVEIEAATPFYPAEEYHQDYYKKNPAHYKRYRQGCRRDQRLEQLWGEAAKH